MICFTLMKNDTDILVVVFRSPKKEAHAVMCGLCEGLKVMGIPVFYTEGFPLTGCLAVSFESREFGNVLKQALEA